MLLNNEDGITLIEILASITILFIVIATFFAFFTNAFQYNAMNSDSIKAVNIAREKQAMFKADPLMESALTRFIDNINDGANAADLSASSYPELMLAEAIQPPNPAETDEAKKSSYLLKMNDSKYKVFIYLKGNADFVTCDKSKSLYKVFVEVFQEDKKLTDTYTYFDYETNPSVSCPGL
ncbi:hypothetical protein D0469_00205 [Peribacillus saganii]|uniref:Prepilin-type N-terminal cleavage/methylation domain-containing protein n=1 Tax=Peribacillus saganii TaxID=2303992 RepID=A0A372LUU5_9BACI|nr:hypothetical protein [Peribacillus saganii]RFU71570.1 hypothetical protein D0469_00205 [Peribacillus saganii]